MITYRRIHLKCQRKPDGKGYIGLRSTRHPVFNYAYTSGKWYLPKGVVQSLIGGLIFLHESKTQTSYFGGLIYDWEDTPDPTKPNEDRVSFKFLAVTDGRFVRWSGRDHVMAWQSDVVPPDEPIIRDIPVQQRHVGKAARTLADIPEDFIRDLQARASATQLE